MTSVCLYFEVHQPFRLKWFWPASDAPQTSLEDRYFDAPLNEFTFKKVAGKCYWPANTTILNNIDYFKGSKKKFKCAYSITGVLLEQAERWDKDLLETWKQMAESGCVEFLDETYHHSLASLFDNHVEFTEQILLHKQKMKDLLGYTPTVFRNTELLYHDNIAETIEQLGYKAILTEGIERILEGWRSPNYVYKRAGGDLKVLLRNYQLSDDIGYRFSAKWWSEYPLTAEKYSAWLSATSGDTINVFMDYETFGEHHWEDTGIFAFLAALPGEILKWEHMEFNTPSEVIEKYQPVGEIRVPWYETVCWADMERDTSAWLGNHMQQLSFTLLKQLEKPVKESRNPEFIETWRKLLTGDHLYYQCTKGWGDGDVHTYFSHHGTPHDAAINLLAILGDFREKVAAYNAARKTPPTIPAPPMTPYIPKPELTFKPPEKEAPPQIQSPYLPEKTPAKKETPQKEDEQSFTKKYGTIKGMSEAAQYKKPEVDIQKYKIRSQSTKHHTPMLDDILKKRHEKERKK
ncbi:Glycosyl hydrolase family 57 [uncultured archaeon]|nr:Glycosyl hydrolase family 57 [uncultured archaeon]